MQSLIISSIIKHFNYLWQSPNDNFPKALLIKVLQCAVFISLLSTILNLFIEIPIFVALVGFSITIISYLLLVWAQKGYNLNLLKNIFTVICFIVLNSLWIKNNGSDGPIIILSIIFLFLLLFIWSEKEHKLYVPLFFLNITLLFAVQILAPNIIQNYATPTQRHIDIMVLTYISLTLTIPIILYVKKSYIAGKQKVDESEKFKTAFLANMSHEIRTPMNSILGFSELLRDTTINSDEKDYYLEIIQTNGKMLLQLLNNIMEISRLDANIVKPVLRNIDIDSLFKQIHLAFKHDFDANPHILFKVAIPPTSSKDVPFFGDELMIYQIMSNLVSNAIKYTNKGIIVMGYKKNFTNNTIDLYVSDTGVGIEPSKIKYIFKRFARADDTYTQKYGGVGLGLSITEELVKLLGGNIKVQSTKGKGSCFTVELPLKRFDVDTFIANHNWN